MVPIPARGKLAGVEATVGVVFIAVIAPLPRSNINIPVPAHRRGAVDVAGFRLASIIANLHPTLNVPVPAGCQLAGSEAAVRVTLVGIIAGLNPQPHLGVPAGGHNAAGQTIVGVHIVAIIASLTVLRIEHPVSTVGGVPGPHLTGAVADVAELLSVITGLGVGVTVLALLSIVGVQGSIPAVRPHQGERRRAGAVAPLTLLDAVGAGGLGDAVAVITEFLVTRIHRPIAAIGHHPGHLGALGGTNHALGLAIVTGLHFRVAVVAGLPYLQDAVPAFSLRAYAKPRVLVAGVPLCAIARGRAGVLVWRYLIGRNRTTNAPPEEHHQQDSQRFPHHVPPTVTTAPEVVICTLTDSESGSSIKKSQ